MPIMAKSNDEYTEVKAIKTPDGTEIDYVLSKVDNTYKRTYTAIRELEDAPPLEFKSIKPQANLLDYRIYGQTSRNLLQNTATSQTINGVTFTVNSDCSVTCNGTANNTALFVIHNFPRFSGECILSGCPMDGSQNTYRLQYTNTRDMSYKDYGTGCNIYQFDETQYPLSAISIRIENGYTCNNLTFYPMIRLATIEDDTYEPYGESVGDLVTSGEHAGEYKVPVTVSNGTDTLTTPIYLPEQIKKVGDEAEYIDYGEQKQHRVRKNLWSGVVEQGSVSTVGVYDYSTKRVRSRNIPIEPGAYTFSANLLIRVIYAFNDDNKIGVCIDASRGTYSRSFTVPTGANNISIGMMKYVDGVEVDITPSDFTWGQIEKGSEATTYEPYIENTDIDVTLPALPTVTGTNVLSVGTEVQPSDMYIKGNFKMIAGGGE